MGKMADIHTHNFDSRSIGLCIGTIFLKMIAEMNTSDFANVFTALAAITTIGYNVVSFYKKFIKKG
jgi:hypothetical protein